MADGNKLNTLLPENSLDCSNSSCGQHRTTLCRNENLCRSSELLLASEFVVTVNTCRVALKRGEAVSKELNKTYGDDKKMSKQEKEERQVD